jgi:hypothetical protein
MFGPISAPDFESLEKKVPNLVLELRNFSKTLSLRLLGSLFLVPHLHGNHPRLRCLTALIVRNCRGSQEPTLLNLENWLNKGLEPLQISLLEDPRQEVFIRRLVSPLGDFLIPEGSITGNASRLNHFLRATSAICDEQSKFTSLFDEAANALRLLHLLVSKNEMPAFITGPDHSGLPFALSQLDSLPSSEISAAELEKHKVDLRLLETLDTTTPRLEGDLFESPLNEVGLRASEDGIIVFDPGAVVVWLQRQILRAHIKTGTQEQFEIELSKNLEIECCVESSRKKAHWRYFDKGSPSQSLSDDCWRIAIAQQKGGEILVRFSIFVRPWYFLTDAFGRSPKDTIAPPKKVLKQLNNWLGSSHPDAAILFLYVVSDHVGLIHQRPPQMGAVQYHSTISQDHFVAFMQHPEISWLDLKHTIEQVLRIEDQGGKIYTLDGLGSLMSYCLTTGGFVTPFEAYFDRNKSHDIFLKESVRQLASEGLQQSDWRTAYNILNNENVVVFTDSELTSENGLPRVRAYHSPAIFQKDIISKVVFFGKSSIWIEVERIDLMGKFGQTYAIFTQTVVQWLQEILEEWPQDKLNMATPAFHLRIKVEDADIQELFERPLQSGTVIQTKQLVPFCVELTLTKIGLRGMAEARNKVEGKIVEALISFLRELCKVELTKNELIRLESVAEQSNARFMHFTEMDSSRSFAGEYAGDSMQTLRPSSKALIGYEVCSSLAEERNQLGCTIYGEEAKDFLRDCIKRLEEYLIQQCEAFSLEPLIVKCLENSEFIIADRERFHRTTTAIEALDRDNSRQPREEFAERESRRAEAATASRAIIEFALAANPLSRRSCSDFEFGKMLATASLIAAVGQLRDSFQYGLQSMGLKIENNGVFRSESENFSEVIFSHISSLNTDAYNDALEKYSPEKKDQEPQDDSKIDSTERDEYIEAFHAEFEVSVEELILFSIQMANMQNQAEELVVTVSRENFSKMADEVAPTLGERLLASFSLERRTDYYSLPENTHESERYLWRNGRMLSLTRKPFIQFEGNVIFAPAFLKNHAEKLLQDIWDAFIPTSSCRSEALSKWLGKRKKKSGDDFEEEVRKLLRDHGYQAEQLTMGQLGKPKDQSDVDVVAWKPGNEIVWIIECKNLKTCLNTADIGNQFSRFKGEDNKDDYLTKHLRRLKWIEANPSGTAKTTGIATPQFKGLVLTSGPAPLKWFPEITAKANFARFDDLIETVSASGTP